MVNPFFLIFFLCFFPCFFVPFVYTPLIEHQPVHRGRAAAAWGRGRARPGDRLLEDALHLLPAREVHQDPRTVLLTQQQQGKKSITKCYGVPEA